MPFTLRGHRASGRAALSRGGAIISHNLRGRGSNQWLPADYFCRSLLARRYRATLRPGHTRVVPLRQREDWRLSYALNPFRRSRNGRQVLVWQWIVFLPDPDARTGLNLRLVQCMVPDGLVLGLGPRPFMVRCT